MLIFFALPNAYGLTQSDLLALERLKSVNKIVVISKCDSMSPAELKKLKEKISKQMKDRGIESNTEFYDE